MKRLICFILVALLLVPVLAMPAVAAEVYEFEYFERPVVLGDDYSFSDSGGFYIYDGLVPPGIYDFYLNGVAFSSITLAFDQPGLGADGASFFTLQDDSGFSLAGACGYLDGATMILLEDESSGNVIKLVRVGDLPSDSGVILTGFLDTMKTGLQDYNTINLGTILVFGLILACTPALCWFGYRILKRKFSKAYFKGRV